ncbi:MAG: hypothetical protein IBX71_08980, partial [Candidatus Desulforudis sp.]|nr:hypothetical protein [Desulforudis sp.]
MHREWNDQRWEKAMREAVQERLAPAGQARRDVQWRRLREQIESSSAGRRLRLGPWQVSRLGLAACCLLLVIALVPLAFSDQFAGIGSRMLTSVAVKDDSPKVGLTAGESPEAATLKRPAVSLEGLGATEGHVLEGLGDADLRPPEDARRMAPYGWGGADPELDSDQFGAAGMASVDVTETAGEPDQDEGSLGIAATPSGVRDRLTLNDVREIVPFTVRLPGELPTGFTRVDITFEAHSPESGKLILFFDHPDGRYLRIEQEPLVGPSPAISDESAQWVTVRNLTGQMLVRNDTW